MAVAPPAALEALLAAAPTRVYLKPGDVCSICLEQFSDAAVTIAAESQGADAATALRRLDPSLVGMRCGHVLHTQCAEAAVQNTNGRHVRCPLCREPVTLAGATSARFFS